MTTEYISAITLDAASIAKRGGDFDHERTVAMNDIVEWNHFAIKAAAGPYALKLSTAGTRITLTAESPSLDRPLIIAVPLAPFRGVIRDYFLICESYFAAVRAGNLPRIEAIDMSRRGLHNEGAELLTTLLADKVTMDTETARRLFTLICVLHLK